MGGGRYIVRIVGDAEVVVPPALAVGCVLLYGAPWWQ